MWVTHKIIFPPVVRFLLLQNKANKKHLEILFHTVHSEAGRSEAAGYQCDCGLGCLEIVSALLNKNAQSCIIFQ